MSNDKMNDSVFGDNSLWSLVPQATQPNIATEDHLQSLGLDVNERLPQFKLNEPGPAALASSIFQQNNMVTDEDAEQSFVVLGKTSFESIRDASMASYLEIKEKSLLIDHNSLISSMSPIEIEESLRKVLEENLKLKETLKQNNTAIKMQFNTITKWQQEVMTVCDNQKQKFEETKELISRLKKENDEYKEIIAKNQVQDLSQSIDQDTLTYDCNRLTSLDKLETQKQKHFLEEGFALEKALPSELLESNKLTVCPEAKSLSKPIKSNEKDASTKLNENSSLAKSSEMDTSVKLNEKDTETESNEKDISIKSKGKDILTDTCDLDDIIDAMQKPVAYNELIYNNYLKPALEVDTVRPASDTITKSNLSRSENVPTVSLDNLLKEDNEYFLKKIDLLSGELNSAKVNYLATKEVLEELEKRYCTDIEIFSQQLQKANKELDSYKQKSNPVNSLELQKLVNNCCEKDMRLKYLEEIISSLESQIRKLEKNGFPLVDLEIEPSQESSDERQQLKQKVEFFNAKLADLNKCFASQCSRYLRTQECLKETACIVQTFENAHLLPNDMITEEKLKNYKEKLCEYRKTLISEQLKSIDDKQTTIKTQQQFQKILSDYNLVICELEILKDENSKLLTMQAKAEEENSLKWAEIEKHLDEEREILEKEKTDLLEATLAVQIEKKLILEEKRKIESERNALVSERERLHEEKISLVEEKTSLDRQSKLYEAEEGSLQKEKRILQKRIACLSDEIEDLKHYLEDSHQLVQELQFENRQLKENEELITVYKIQTEEREKEFEDMRGIHKNLQDQLQALAMANLELRSENDRLGGRERQEQQANNSGESVDRNFVNVLICPKCKNGFVARNITAHLQQCMSSD